jgi:biotin transport system substrate-specific component
MLRTLPRTRDFSEVQRLLAIAAFTFLTIIAARIEIPAHPVPFTMQPFVVLLAGMVLGARDGALSQFAYVSLIALGLPVDANALGTAALFGTTGGYLIGFIAAAGVVGLLVESGAVALWRQQLIDTLHVAPERADVWAERISFAQRLIAGVIGIAVIYVFGIVVLRNVADLSWSRAWALGGEPFLGLDLVKAVIAAGLSESARRGLLRMFQAGGRA